MTFWEDNDVQWINAGDSLNPNLALGDLEDRDRDLVLRFIQYDEAAGNVAPAEAFIDAVLSGVAAFENISSFTPHGRLENPQWRGWRKFLLWAAGLNVSILAQQSPPPPEAALYAAWAVDAFDRFRWTQLDNQTMRDLLAGLQHIAASAAPDRTSRARVAAAVAADADRRFPSAPPEFDPTEYNHLDTAAAEVQRVQSVLAGVDLSGELVDTSPYGWALALRIDDDSFTIVSKSANGQRPGLVNISSGALTEVEGPRDAILAVCNEYCSYGRFASCFYDASTASAVVRASLPLPVVEIPQFAQSLVQAVAGDAFDRQARFAEKRIYGRAFGWNSDDVRRLVMINAV